MIKQSSHIKKSILIFSRDYCELPNRTNRAKGKIYLIFKPHDFRDTSNIYQDKASMDMTFSEYTILTSSSRN